MVWIAIHVPHAALPLVAGAGVLVVGVVVARGPLGLVPLTGFRAHRRCLVAEAVVVVVAPFPTGHATDPVVVAPCLLVAAVLLRCGVGRWAGKAAEPVPAAVADGVPAATTGGPVLSKSQRELVRRAGRVGGRAGTLVARHADVAVPQGARAAGRLVGRLRPTPKR